MDRIPSLQLQAQAVLVKILEAMPNLQARSIEIVQKYLLLVYPHQSSLAIACHYHYSAQLTRIFLPSLLVKGTLHVTASNAATVNNYCTAMDIKELCAKVTHLCIDTAKGKDYMALLPILSQFSGLRILQLGSWTTDDLLAVIGVNCPLLHVLDAKDDSTSSATDLGLAYITRCQQLRRVLFSNYADEYDYEDKLRFTGRGIAFLLMALPLLENIQCSEYLLRDALHFLYQTSSSRMQLPLLILQLAYPEVRACTLQVVPILCPKLQALSLYLEVSKEAVIGKALKSLLHLKNVIITVETGCLLSGLNFPSFGPRLIYLQITTHLLKCEEIILLSQCCPLLRTFTLKMHSFGFDGIPVEEMRAPLFPQLENLELMQNISVGLFKLLNGGVHRLHRLFLGRACIHGLSSALAAVHQMGGLRQLRVIVLPGAQLLPMDILKWLVVSLPELQVIVADFLQQQEETELRSFLRLCAPCVLLKDAEDVPLPSHMAFVL